MSRKNLKKLKKMTIVTIMLVSIIIPNIASAAFSYPQSNLFTTSILDLVKGRYASISQYKSFLGELGNFTQGIDTNASITDTKIQLIDKVDELQDKYNDTTIISSVSSQILSSVIATPNTESTENLLANITSNLNIFSKNSSLAIKSLTPDVVVDNMEATTAGELSGEEYKVKLSGNIYYANVDSNGQPTSDKWAVLVHGFSMNGQAIADSLGEMYLDQGFNVLAPDLRGFGNSEGSGGMGYLESLDIWDWLTYLNNTYANKCSEIIVHGVSLGGATTIYLSGLEVNGEDITDKNVIGLVEDCGYTSMTGIITDLLDYYSDNVLVEKILGIFGKASLGDIAGEEDLKKYIIENLGVGLTEENFDTLQNGLNSLNNSKVALMIVHGTDDTTVPVKNSTEIYNVAMQNDNIPYVQKFIAEGENHAFIILGSKYNVYKGHIKNFIEQAEKVKDGTVVQKEATYQEEEEEETSVITSLVKALKLIKNMLK